jgi:autotransporter strand-loop-strand O-heptosyltransferase
MIRTFLQTFNRTEPVDLIISVDNPFPADGLKSTEERLHVYKLKDKRIKVLHFPDRQEYISHLKSAHCFLSCARSEGWGLPLCEAIACGIPTIASNYGAQLDFAGNTSHLVNIKNHLRPKQVFMQKDEDLLGTYAEPDFDHLSHIMRYVYENYQECKIKALADSKTIRDRFSWENAVNIALDHIKNITSEEIKEHNKRIFKTPAESVDYLFQNGAKCTINGPKKFDYHIKFIDMDTNEIVHQQTVKTGHWVKTNRKYYTNWKVTVEVEDKLYSEHIMNLQNKRVIIVLDSTALGDRICWMPYVEEFRKKHNCTIFVATGINWMFKDSYPELNFIPHGITLPDIYATYNIIMEDNDHDNNKQNWHLIPLQQTASDFLGLEYKEIRPIITVKKLKRPIKEKYVCISEHSTFRCKYWNHQKGWQILINYLNEIGYKVMVISKERTLLKNIINKTNKTLEETVNNLQHCEFFITISSGLAWIAWGLNIPLAIISGCTKPFVEMKDCIRIFNSDVCNGCFNDPDIDLEKNNWDFCPRRQNFICSTSITPEMVINQIQPLIRKI